MSSVQSRFDRLLTAIRIKNRDEIRTLMSDLAGYVINGESSDANGSIPLHEVVKLGDKDILKLFLENKDVDVNVKDTRGFTALHYVVEREYFVEAQILIEAGADIVAPNENGKSPLHILIEKQVDSRKIESLINLKNRRGENSLFSAVQLGIPELVNLLIDYGCDLKCVSSWGGSTLLHEAARCNQGNSHFSVAETLLKKGADVNAQNSCGSSPLRALIFSSGVETVQLLLDSGADVNAKDKNGQTPLFRAAEYGEHEIAQLLLDSGSSVNAVDGKKSSTPLHVAASSAFQCRKFETIEVLLKNGADVNAKDNEGKIPLHHLVKEVGNNAKSVKILLDYKSEVNVKDSDGQIPLLYGIVYQNFETLQVLLEHGSDVNSSNGLKKTALHLAVTNEVDSKIVKLLLKYGADANALDWQRKTPLLILFELWDRYMCSDSLSKYELVKEYFPILLDYTDINLLGVNSGFHGRVCCILSRIAKDDRLKIILEHVAKWQALGVMIDPRFTHSVLEYRAKYSDYFEKCSRELTAAKNTKLQDSWVTFFNLLVDDRKKMKNYAGNFGLVKEFEKSDYKIKFPIYGPYMEKNVNKGIKRRELFDWSSIKLSTNLLIFCPSHLIIRDIFDCLSTKDLSKFCE